MCILCFFNDTATTEIYTLSLHDALPIYLIPGRGSIDFRSVFDAMDDIGYRGFVTVELYPYQDNPVEAAKEAYSYLCRDRKSTRLNSSHANISYAVFCLKKKKSTLTHLDQ